MSGAIDALSGPNAGTFAKIASIGLPILAGVGAAASPAGARGLSGLTQGLGAIASLREAGRKEAEERQFGETIAGLGPDVIKLLGPEQGKIVSGLLSAARDPARRDDEPYDQAHERARRADHSQMGRADSCSTATG